MNKRQDVITCYNRTAKQYAEKFMHELDHKHFDRIILTAFAKENSGKGTCIDLGCGPGQTTKFLFDAGMRQILGTDISPAMITEAASQHPGMKFECADMLALSYPNNAFGSAVAFYSIVHFTETELECAFSGIQKLLIIGGQFLFSFHIGDDVIHLHNFLDRKVNIEFHFFQPANIRMLLANAGFKIIDSTEREPYADVEHPSRRAYIWAEKFK